MRALRFNRTSSVSIWSPECGGSANFRDYSTVHPISDTLLSDLQYGGSQFAKHVTSTLSPARYGSTTISAALQNQVAVVTGSSRGIGRAIALSLARQQAAVVVHGCRSAAEAEEVVCTIKAQGGVATARLADLRDAAELSGFVDAAFQWQSRVDIWVNNAGFDALTGDATQLSFDKKLQELWLTDVLATIRCSRLVGAKMKSAGQGHIINVGWDQAWQGMEGDSGEMFAATKGAVMAFTKSCAKSLAPEVRVNCVAPGWIQTKWAADHASEYWQQRAVGESLRARWGTPEDVAAAVSFLSTPAADFINGHILPVNGGFRSAHSKDLRDD